MILFISRDTFCTQALLTFSLLISEAFWAFLSFPNDRSVFVPSDTCAEMLRSLGNSRESQKSSLISKEEDSAQNRFSANGACAPSENRGFNENGENDERTVCCKNEEFAPQTPAKR